VIEAASANDIEALIAVVQYRVVRWWKILGLAGLVGATAVGIAAGSRAVERRRREYREADPDELRTRLHERLAEAGAPANDDAKR
jgi:hypothetical protein